ncbi:lipopolysaccharide-induced tumor necrosis factor-alpha factor homolog [Acanthaster planci]|uniref:Lipopolysaccharide-induced tumor necrosis factor-alpha factor homolog n=1 Tax=Acanthaster planci TaxID=133434 RepID=A0A8B7Y942_ACAPL|nr:lipopolysaccharide-induced tumor necrosis factor-alpha factor homolog [Acanthaster planci]
MATTKEQEAQPLPYPSYQSGPMQPQSAMPPASGPIPPTIPAPMSTAAQSTVCVQSTVIFGEFSTAMQCPHCQNTINTRISHQVGLLTWLVAGGICLFGGFLGCCLIPFCLDFCLDVVHSCPTCNHQLGVYQRLH